MGISLVQCQRQTCRLTTRDWQSTSHCDLTSNSSSNSCCWLIVLVMHCCLVKVKRWQSMLLKESVFHVVERLVLHLMRSRHSRIRDTSWVAAGKECLLSRLLDCSLIVTWLDIDGWRLFVSGKRTRYTVLMTSEWAALNCSVSITSQFVWFVQACSCYVQPCWEIEEGDKDLDWIPLTCTSESEGEEWMMLPDTEPQNSTTL